MHWSRRLTIYKEIEKRMEQMNESEAIISLQIELDDFAKKGRSKKPNLADFSKELNKNMV